MRRKKLNLIKDREATGGTDAKALISLIPALRVKQLVVIEVISKYITVNSRGYLRFLP